MMICYCFPVTQSIYNATHLLHCIPLCMPCFHVFICAPHPGDLVLAILQKKVIVGRFEVVTAVLLRPDTLTLRLCFSIFLKEYGALVFNS